MKKSPDSMRAAGWMEKCQVVAIDTVGCGRNLVSSVLHVYEGRVKSTPKPNLLMKN